MRSAERHVLDRIAEEIMLVMMLVGIGRDDDRRGEDALTAVVAGPHIEEMAGIGDGGGIGAADLQADVVDHSGPPPSVGAAGPAIR